MKKFTIKQFVVAGIAILMAILALVIPSIVLPEKNKLVLGFVTTFGGVIRNYNGANPRINFPTPLFIAWLLPLIACALALAFGKTQKSTYFFTFCLFVASGIMYRLTLTYLYPIDIAGGIPGFQSAEISAQPIVMMVFSGIGALASLVAIFYNPNRRGKRY